MGCSINMLSNIKAKHWSYNYLKTRILYKNIVASHKITMVLKIQNMFTGNLSILIF